MTVCYRRRGDCGLEASTFLSLPYLSPPRANKSGVRDLVYLCPALDEGVSGVVDNCRSGSGVVQ